MGFCCSFPVLNRADTQGPCLSVGISEEDVRPFINRVDIVTLVFGKSQITTPTVTYSSAECVDG